MLFELRGGGLPRQSRRSQERKKVNCRTNCERTPGALTGRGDQRLQQTRDPLKDVLEAIQDNRGYTEAPELVPWI
jgi:hypothetical protein